MKHNNINYRKFEDSMGKYSKYCMKLQKSYDTKHGEVEEYARLIREIKNDVDALLKDSWEKSDANRKYLLNIIQINLPSLKKGLSKQNMKRLKKLIDAQKNKIKETTVLVGKINGKLLGLDDRLGKITTNFPQQPQSFNLSGGANSTNITIPGINNLNNIEKAAAAGATAAASLEEEAGAGAGEVATEAAAEAAAAAAAAGKAAEDKAKATAAKGNSEFRRNASEEEAAEQEAAAASAEQAAAATSEKSASAEEENTSNNNEVEDVEIYEDVEKFKEFIEKEAAAFEKRQASREGSLNEDMPEHGKQLTEYISYCDKLQYYYYIKHGEVLELVEIITGIQSALEDINLENNKKDNEDIEDIEFLIRIIRKSSPITDISIALHGALNKKREQQEDLMIESRSISKTLIETLNRIKSGAPPTPPTRIKGLENPMYYVPQNYNPTQGPYYPYSHPWYENVDSMGRPISKGPFPSHKGHAGVPRAFINQGNTGVSGPGNLGSGGSISPINPIEYAVPFSPLATSAGGAMMNPTYDVQQPVYATYGGGGSGTAQIPVNQYDGIAAPLRRSLRRRLQSQYQDLNSHSGRGKGKGTEQGTEQGTYNRLKINGKGTGTGTEAEQAAAYIAAMNLQKVNNTGSVESGAAGGVSGSGEFYGALGAEAPGSVNSSGYVKVSPPKPNSFGNYPQTPEALDPNKGPENNKLRRNQETENKKARQIQSSVNSSKGGAKQTRKLGILKKCCNKGSKKNQFLGTIKPDKGQKITFKANQNNKDSLKSLIGKKVSYTLQNGFAANIEEFVEPTPSSSSSSVNNFPSLTAHKSKKKRGGPSNIKATYYNPQNKKTKGGPRMLKATGGARKKNKKNKKTRKRRL